MLKQPWHVCMHTLPQGFLKAEEALKANRMKICMAEEQRLVHKGQPIIHRETMPREESKDS